MRSAELVVAAWGGRTCVPRVGSLNFGFPHPSVVRTPGLREVDSEPNSFVTRRLNSAIGLGKVVIQMNPVPSCETVGMFDLCAPAHVLTLGDWFVVQLPNLLWFSAALVLVVAGIFVPFPTRAVETEPARVPKVRS